MLELVRGCVVPGRQLLHEEYERGENTLTANVNAGKIGEVLRHFIAMQTERVFFILELPTSAGDEERLRKKGTDPFHRDVYYIDGLDGDHALALLERYGELLIHDGMSTFCFGAHDGSAELMVGKYNVVTLWTREMGRYEGFFEAHQIFRVGRCLTAWDTFKTEGPGRSMTLDVDGMRVYDLPEALKGWGIYLAEQREE